MHIKKPLIEFLNELRTFLATALLFADWKTNKTTEVMDDDQSGVLRQLSKYLEQNPSNETVKLRESLQQGHCHGLSICHAAMGAIGKMRWWESALIEVATWDGKNESLENLILLPDAIDGQLIPLRMVFTKVLNYIKSYHVNRFVAEFRKAGANCLNVLSPSGKYLEILDKKKVKTVTRLTAFTGYFTKDQLKKLLDSEYVQENLCIIHCTSHATRIGNVDVTQWLYYDPNYPHAKKNKPIHKIMSKEELIDEIVQIHGQSLHIEIAQLERRKSINKPVHEYEQMLNHGLLGLLKEYGFHQIIREAPHLLNRILKRAKKNKKIANAITQALAVAPPKIWTGEKMLSIMNNALQSIAVYHPEYLERVIKIARHSDNGMALLAKGFLEFSDQDDDACALCVIAEYHPLMFPKVLDYMEEFVKDKFSTLICNALVTHQDVRAIDSYTNGLTLFDKYASTIMPRLLSIVDAHPKGYEFLLKALAYLEKKPLKQDGCSYHYITCFEQLMQAESKNLNTIMQHITKNLNAAKVEAILAQAYLLFLFATHKPQAFHLVMDFISQSRIGALFDTLLVNLCARTVDSDESYFVYALKNNKKALINSIEVLSKSEGGCEHIISIFCGKNRVGKMDCHTILDSKLSSDHLPVLEAVVKLMEQRSQFTDDKTFNGHWMLNLLKGIFFLLCAILTMMISDTLDTNFQVQRGDTCYGINIALVMLIYYCSYCIVQFSDAENYFKLKNNLIELNSVLKSNPNSTDDLFNPVSEIKPTNSTSTFSEYIEFSFFYLIHRDKMKNTQTELYGKLKDIVTLFSQKNGTHSCVNAKGNAIEPLLISRLG